MGWRWGSGRVVVGFAPLAITSWTGVSTGGWVLSSVSVFGTSRRELGECWPLPWLAISNVAAIAGVADGSLVVAHRGVGAISTVR